jgi:hypothetical protein
MKVQGNERGGKRDGGNEERDGSSKFWRCLRVRPQQPRVTHRRVILQPQFHVLASDRKPTRGGDRLRRVEQYRHEMVKRSRLGTRTRSSVR